jgi:hypothetical protein
MAHLLTVAERPVVPDEVWVRLAATEQQRVVRLMAQLASQVVTAQRPAPRKEEQHACSPGQHQTPC